MNLIFLFFFFRNPCNFLEKNQYVSRAKKELHHEQRYYCLLLSLSGLIVVRGNRIAIGNPIIDRDKVTICDWSASLWEINPDGEKTLKELRDAYFVSKCKYIVREKERERESVFWKMRQIDWREELSFYLFFYYLQRDIYNNLFPKIFMYVIFIKVESILQIYARGFNLSLTKWIIQLWKWRRTFDRLNNSSK